MGTATVTALAGDPMAIHGSADRWRAFGYAATTAAVEVAAQAALAFEFVGDEGDSYRGRLADLASGLGIAGDAWGQVAAALDLFARELADCQHELRNLALTESDSVQPPTTNQNPVQSTNRHPAEYPPADRESADRVGAPGESVVRQRVQRIHERHRTAVRQCCAAIDRARALAPRQDGIVQGLAKPGTANFRTGSTALPVGSLRSGIEAVSQGLRIAAATATRAGGLGLHRGAAWQNLSAADDDSSADIPESFKPGGAVWKHIYAACMAFPPEGGLDPFDTSQHGFCMGVANTVALDPTLLPTVIVQYSAYFLHSGNYTSSWTAVGNVFADLGGMIADVTGISTCFDGDVVGCTLTAAGMVIGGPVGGSAARAARVGAKAASGSRKAAKVGSKEASAARKGVDAPGGAAGHPSRAEHQVEQNRPGDQPASAAARQAAEVEAARAQAVRDTLMPGGKLIGEEGSGPLIRELPGGVTRAQEMFSILRRGGVVVEDSAKQIRVRLPDGGFVNYRRKMTKSPHTVITIDVNIAQISDEPLKIKFNP